MKLGLIPFMDREHGTDGGYTRRFLRMADAAGVESVWTVEHPIVAEDYEPLYSYSTDGRAPFEVGVTEMSDPLEWLAFAAGVTETIKLGTGVLLLPLHAPIILAKRVATLDALSGGRVLLGVGMGWQKEEYQTIGIPYEERGPRLDEGIAAVRALWTQSPATHHGAFYNFDRVHSDPKPLRAEGVPILIGGSTDLAARRAGRSGDGFYPHAISPDDLAKRVETMHAAAREAGRDPDAIEITVAPGSWQWGASADRGAMQAYAAAGVTRFVTMANEAMSDDLTVIDRFLRHYREEILAGL
jgi:probable F420-dependent oxidoreductase